MCAVCSVSLPPREAFGRLSFYRNVIVYAIVETFVELSKLFRYDIIVIIERYDRNFRYDIQHFS